MSTSARDINISIMRRSAPALRSPTTRQCCTASAPHPALPDHAAATSPTEDVCPRRLQRQLTNQPGLASQPQGEHRDHDQRATHPMKAINRFHRSPPAQVDAPAEHNRDRRPRMTIVDRTDQVSGANRGISKGGLRMDGDRLVRDASPAWLRKGVEASPEALGTDYIDLYQVHWPDPATPIGETAAALAELVREGLIRHVGVS